MVYEVRHATGTRNIHCTYQSALAEIDGRYPDAVTSYADDGRTLVWNCERSSNGRVLVTVAEINRVNEVDALESIQ